MLKAKVYNLDGSVKEEVDLPKEVFGVAVNRELLHRVLLARAFSRRHPIADTKTRGEVRGGGKKPWRQKGTGRARHSSIRSPLWKGGGVVFGPTSERSWERKVNAKALKAAFACALAARWKSKKLTWVDAFAVKEPKTKLFLETWGRLMQSVAPLQGSQVGIRKKGMELLMVSGRAQTDALQRASRNIPGVKITTAENVALEDVAGYRYVVMEPSAITVLVRRCAMKNLK